MKDGSEEIFWKILDTLLAVKGIHSTDNFIERLISFEINNIKDLIELAGEDCIQFRSCLNESNSLDSATNYQESGNDSNFVSSIKSIVFVSLVCLMERSMKTRSLISTTGIVFDCK